MSVPPYLTLAVALGFVCGCAQAPPRNRPGSVPTEAVFVNGGKLGGWWELCRLENAGETIYCRIWNRAGLIQYDDQFLPADGNAPPTAEELRISPAPKFPGPDRIILTNRRVLLPKSRFDELKRSVDCIAGGSTAAVNQCAVDNPVSLCYLK